MLLPTPPPISGSARWIDSDIFMVPALLSPRLRHLLAVMIPLNAAYFLWGLLLAAVLVAAFRFLGEGAGAGTGLLVGIGGAALVLSGAWLWSASGTQTTEASHPARMPQKPPPAPKQRARPASYPYDPHSEAAPPSPFAPAPAPGQVSTPSDDPTRWVLPGETLTPAHPLVQGHRVFEPYVNQFTAAERQGGGGGGPRRRVTFAAAAADDDTPLPPEALDRRGRPYAEPMVTEQPVIPGILPWVDRNAPDIPDPQALALAAPPQMLLETPQQTARFCGDPQRFPDREYFSQRLGLELLGVDGGNPNNLTSYVNIQRPTISLAPDPADVLPRDAVPENVTNFRQPGGD